MVEQRGMVIHIAAGYFLGTIAWQKGPDNDVSSNFVVAGPRDVKYGIRDGQIAQVVDTSMAAWTQRAGNGHWDSVECSGFVGDSLSAAQMESIAQLFARGHREHGWRLSIATDPNGYGLGHHSMGTNGPTDDWTGPQWGHELCPGPKIIAQKPAILARAIQIVNGGGDDMTPIQEFTLHIMNYRLNGLVQMLDPIVIPAFKSTDGTLIRPSTSEVNHQAQAIRGIPTTSLPVDVDEAAIAAEVVAQIDVPTAAENADAVLDAEAARLAD
jgi:hypothetical protein